MYKKISWIFKLFGLIFILFAMVSIGSSITFMVTLLNADILGYIFKIVLNLGYIITGIVCFISKEVGILNRMFSIMTVILILIYILLKVKINLAVISINMISLFIAFIISCKFIKVDTFKD